MSVHAAALDEEVHSLTQQSGASPGAGEPVSAGTVQGSALAEEARSRLQAAGIQATLRPQPEAAVGANSSPLGTIAVMVLPVDVERALQIVEELKREHSAP